MTRRVCLGMPAYGQMTTGASRSLWRASRGRVVIDGAAEDLDLQVSINETSLLAHNFNLLWVWALNMAAEVNVDYFAMLHADMEPQDFWLDDMIAEMEANDIDVLGAVSPIKDSHGLTSLALDRPGESFRPLCRLTLAEIDKLPMVFTSDDCGGHKLLLNTGCWVCRFDPRWAARVHFEINDRIVASKSTGRYHAEVEPEDWNFSRQLHALGLRVGATRNVSLVHRGQAAYGNTHNWGSEQFDSQYTDRSLIPVSPAAWRFPADVDGWMTAQEGRFLADSCRDLDVLEIGSYAGRSTICIAQTARSVTSVDTHDGQGTSRPRDTMADLHANLIRFGVARKVSAWKMSSREWSLIRLPGTYDLAFIDGAHDAEAVAEDIEIATRFLRPGGLLAFHDHHPGDPGVMVAVGDLVANGGQIVKQQGTVALVRPPQLIGA